MIRIFRLTEALDNLLAKEGEKAAFLKTAAEGKEVAAEIDGGKTVEEAIETVYGAALGALNTVIEDKSGVTADLDPKLSAAYNEAIVAEAQGILEKAVADAEKSVVETAGLSKAANGLASAQQGFAAAQEAAKVASADVAGAVATFDALEVKLSSTAPGNINLSLDGSYPTSAAEIKSFNDGDALVLDGSTPAIIYKDGKVQAATAYKDVKALQAVISAIQAEFAALNRVQTSEKSLANAVKAVLDIEDEDWDATPAKAASTIKWVNEAAPTTELAGADIPTAVVKIGTKLYITKGSDKHEVTVLSGEDTAEVTLQIATAADASATGAETTVDLATEYTYQPAAAVVTTYYNTTADADGSYLTPAFAALATKSVALVDAKQDLDAFTKELAAYQAAQAQAAELKQFTTDIEKLTAALEKEYDVAIADVVAPAAAGDDATSIGSANDDIFVFAGESVEISAFGDQGDDMLYVGFAFKEVRLEAGTDVRKTSQGDAAELEMFIAQIGSDTVIALEKKAFDGSVSSTFEGSVITLVGVSADDVKFEDGSIVIAA